MTSDEALPQWTWTDVASVRSALALSDRQLVDRSFLNDFDAKNPAHVATLVALGSAERRVLFEHCSAWRWNKRGPSYGTLAVADAWARTGRFADALSLLDDLTTAPYQDPQTYQLALWAVTHGNSKLGIQRDRARAYLDRSLPHGSQEPAIFHNALCVFLELGDRPGALQALTRALRYGYPREILATDPDLVEALQEPDLRALLDTLEAERPTLLLRERLASLEPEATPLAHPPRRVAARALVLAAIAWRASLPGQRALVLPTDHRTATEELATMRAWMGERGLDAELEPDERALLDAPFSFHMTPRCIDGSWALESAAWLGWALGRLPRPRPQQKLDADATLRALGLGTAEGESLLSTATLRPAPEVRTLHRQLLATRWRLEEWRREPAARIDLVATAARVPGLDLGPGACTRGDLVVAGKPIAQASAAKVERVASLVLERYRASAWLIAPAGTRLYDVDTLV